MFGPIDMSSDMQAAESSRHLRKYRAIHGRTMRPDRVVATVIEAFQDSVPRR